MSRMYYARSKYTSSGINPMRVDRTERYSTDTVGSFFTDGALNEKVKKNEKGLVRRLVIVTRRNECIIYSYVLIKLMTTLMRYRFIIDACGP